MELWDIYDKNRQKTNRVIERGKPLGPGEYHVSVVIVVFNSKGEIFCTRRCPEKQPHAGMWEITGGAVLAGETTRQGAVRELREETGLVIAEESLTLIYRKLHKNDFIDIYALQMDFSVEDIVLQPGETDGAAWFPYREWEAKAKTGEVMSPTWDISDIGQFAALREFAQKGTEK